MDKRSEREVIQEKQSINYVMGTTQGRRFIWDLLSYCGIYQDIAGDNAYVQRSLGKREVGLYLLALVSDYNEEEIFTMMKEAKINDTLKEKEDDDRSKQQRNQSILDDGGSLSGSSRDDDSEYDLPRHEYGGAII